MSIDTLSEHSKRILSSSGWCPGRKEGLSYLHEMVPDHYVKVDSVMDVLREFGGLSIGNRSENSTRHIPIVEIDPSLADSYHDTPAERLDLLYPIGIIESGHADLLLDASGKVFWWFEVKPEYYSATFSDALERLLHGHIDSAGWLLKPKLPRKRLAM